MPTSPQPSSPLSNRLRGLYVITHEHPAACSDSPGDTHSESAHLVIARAALAGGARIVQLRDKNSSPARMFQIAHAVRRLTREYNALFLVNDQLDVALECGADGVHLGPDDMPIGEARRVLGAQRVVGASCGTIEEARRAEQEGATYIGVGAVFGTFTKTDAGPAIGLQRLRDIAGATTLPVAAIGGINAGNIASTRIAGAVMSCVVSAVSGAGDENSMSAATRDLIELLK
jgi:thiamine-phosphate pyrophosphorylase